jgi:hypothetical protein
MYLLVCTTILTRVRNCICSCTSLYFCICRYSCARLYLLVCRLYLIVCVTVLVCSNVLVCCVQLYLCVVNKCIRKFDPYLRGGAVHATVLVRKEVEYARGAVRFPFFLVILVFYRTRQARYTRTSNPLPTADISPQKGIPRLSLKSPTNYTT